MVAPFDPLNLRNDYRRQSEVRRPGLDNTSSNLVTQQAQAVKTATFPLPSKTDTPEDCANGGAEQAVL